MSCSKDRFELMGKEEFRVILRSAKVERTESLSVGAVSYA